jgi:hypothetical protein
VKDLYDEIKKVLHKFNIPIQKLFCVVTDGTPSIAGKNIGLSSLITKDVKKQQAAICLCIIA